MGLLAQVVVSGLAAGALYGLVGIGFSLIYRLGYVLDFAHADLLSFATFVFLFGLAGGASVSVLGVSPGRTALAVLLTLIVLAAIAIAIQRFVVAPFLSSLPGPGTSLGWIAGTAAAGLLLRSLVLTVFPGESYTVPDPIRLQAVLRFSGGNVIELRWFALLAVGLGLAFALDRWLLESQVGRAIRAAADDVEAAALAGISVTRMRALAWGLAGLLIALAALLLAPERPVTPQLGVILGLKGVAAAVVGGLASTRAAVVAGLAIGVGESLVSLATPQLHEIFALALLVAVLAALPERVGVAREVLD